MADTTVLSNISDYTGVAIRRAEEIMGASATNLVNTIRAYDLPEGVGSLKVNTFADLSVETVADGAAPSGNIQLTATAVTFSPNTFSAVTNTVSDIADHAMLESSALVWGEKLGKAAVAGWNSDVFSKFSGFSNVVTASGAVTLDHVNQGVNTLRSTVGDGEDIYFACDYTVLQDLYTDAKANTNNVAADVIGRIYAGEAGLTLFGARVVPVVYTPSDSTDYYCGFYTPDAIGVAFRTFNGSRIKTKTIETATGKALTGYSSYDMKELADSRGVALHCIDLS